MRSTGLLMAVTLILSAGPLNGQIDPTKVGEKAVLDVPPEAVIPMPAIDLEVRLFGGEFTEWKKEYNESDPSVLTFRAMTSLTSLGGLRWYVLASPDDPMSVLAEGQTGALQPGKFVGFTVDFRPVVGSVKQRALSYWVRVIGFEKARRGARPNEIARSNLVRVNFVAPGAPTVFTDLPESPHEADHDQDGLPDLREFNLAEQFKPVFIYDSDEGHRRPNEPVVLFQVRPMDCMGPGCQPRKILIQYAHLYAEDGGYGPSSTCKNAHHGDNQSVSAVIESQDGVSWDVTRFIIDDDFQWPAWSARFLYDQLGRQTHPVIYLSAHKHHHYFDTHYDGEDSPYSSPSPFSPCNEDVNGQGATVWARLLSPDNRPNNVGEPEAHPTQHFVDDLGAYGYPGERAWDDQDFKGGLGDDGGETGPMACMWVGWNPVPAYCE